MKHGEIWWAELPDPAGSGPGYKRPVLIVQSDEFNESKIQTVVCIVITSNLKLAEAPGNLLIKAKDSHLNKDSVINVSQIITLDKSVLIEFVGVVSKSILKKITAGIKLVLYID